jgi:4-hydroxythreonine-4-phosphate dehydrogenase
MGDPAGIGPEVVMKALSVPGVRAAADVVVYGDLGALAQAARVSGLPPEPPSEVVAVSKLDPGAYGFARPSLESDRAQLAYIERAMKDLLAGQGDAIVTAPISKASIARAGARWPGHTEMLAELVGGGRPVMMLVGGRLKVVPLTVHLPLSAVPERISGELVLHGLTVTHGALSKYFGLHKARIAVAGLNPHAGEGGLFGDEESRIIRPAIERAIAQGIQALGPFPGDTVFRRAVEGEFDAVLGMYHDQALIPIKVLDFDRAVNVTLGLPIVRTSVDHGTAYDLAGKGVASAGSMIAALELAASMVRASRRG